MIRNSFLACCLIALSFSFQKDNNRVLRIMTYNIHHGCDIHEKLQLKGMAAIIKKSHAEIVGLEEVDSVCKRSGNTDQAKILAKLTGMHYAYVRHFAFEGGSYGLALLSIFPITNVINKRIPVLTKVNGNTRALLSADLLLPTGKKLNILVAHLDYRSEVSRIAQSEIIMSMLKDKKEPLILVGDLNAEPASKTMANLKAGFTDATGQPGNLTFPSDKPTEKIDYILADKNHFQKTMTTTVYDVRYSDHRPIAATIQLSL